MAKPNPLAQGLTEAGRGGKPGISLFLRTMRYPESEHGIPLCPPSLLIIPPRRTSEGGLVFTPLPYTHVPHKTHAFVLFSPLDSFSPQG
jgi:hypothetical protein